MSGFWAVAQTHAAQFSTQFSLKINSSLNLHENWQKHIKVSHLDLTWLSAHSSESERNPESASEV